MNQPDWTPAVCAHFGWDAQSWEWQTALECWTRYGEPADGEATVSVYDSGWVHWDLGGVAISADVRDDVLTTLRALAAASEALEAAYAAARVKS